MSITLMALTFAKDFAHITDDAPEASTMKLVALSLLDHANDEGRHIYPAIATTAARCNMSRRTVSNALAAFIAAGLFYKVGTAGRHQQVIEYACNVAALRKLPDAVVVPAGRSVRAIANDATAKRLLADALTAPTDHPDDTCAPGSHVHPVHDDVCTRFTGSDAPGAHRTTNDNHHTEPSREGAGGATDGKPKRAKLTPEQTTARRLMFDAIRECSRMIGNDGRIASASKKLCDAGHNDAVVRRVFGPGGAWYRFDWRGQRREPPTPEAMCATLLTLLDLEATGAQPKRPGAGATDGATGFGKMRNALAKARAMKTGG